jgi:putative membrane protein
MSTTTQRTDPVVWVVLALVILLVVPGALMMSFWGVGMMGGSWMGTGWTGWGWGLGALVGLGAILVVLFLVLKAIQATPSRPPAAPYAYGVPPYGMPPGGPAPSDPRAILDARYARGEITRDEYLRMRSDLESGGS